MHLRFYIKTFLLLSLLLITFNGITQRKTIDTALNDTAIHNELNYGDDTITNFHISDSTHFYEKIDFSNSTFSKEADFSNSIFSKQAYFNGANFSKKADFPNATFSKTAKYYTSTFSNDVDFSDATFLNGADFSGATFLKDIQFKNATFKKPLDLSGISMGDSTQFFFGNTHLPDMLDFSNNYKIYNEIDFTTATFTDSSKYDHKTDSLRPVLIYLYKTDISKLHLDYIHFKLLLPDSTLDDPKKIITNDEKESMYEALLNNFKAHGQQESIRLCDIEYQTFKWNQNWWSRKFVWLPKWWWNWGYNKGLIFYRTLLFVCIFTFVTYFLIYYLNSEVYGIRNVPTDKWQKKLSFKDFGNRLWFSFIYTSTVFFRLTLKIEKIKFEKKGGTVYLILMYTIGLICLAYMANFVLQK